MQDYQPLPSIDLELQQKLRDTEYRERFFLAEASAEIARQLIALRKRRGLSQIELAALAKTQQPAVSRAEQADYHNWSFNTLRKLTNAMQGRLRVLIEAWEDVIGEYCPEEHGREADDSAKPRETDSLRTYLFVIDQVPRASAATASEILSPLHIRASKGTVGRGISSSNLQSRREAHELVSAASASATRDRHQGRIEWT